MQFKEAFDEAIDERNELLHAHPYTAPTGEQQLRYWALEQPVEWPVEDVNVAARRFEETAIIGNEIFHGPLANAHPP